MILLLETICNEQIVIELCIACVLLWILLCRVMLFFILVVYDKVLSLSHLGNSRGLCKNDGRCGIGVTRRSSCVVFQNNAYLGTRLLLSLLV